MKEALNKVDGVLQVETSIDTGEATVSYDPGKTTPEAMAKILTDFQGPHDFTASVKKV